MTNSTRVPAWTGALLLLVVLPPVANAQGADDEILLGGIPLRLGMSMDDALAKLGRVYDLRHMDDTPGNWGVFPRGGGGPGWLGMLGTVSFQDEELSYVNKFWRPSAATSDAFANALYQAVKSITNGAPQACTIRTHTYEPAGYPKQHVVDISCGNRGVSIGGYDSINETLWRGW